MVQTGGIQTLAAAALVASTLDAEQRLADAPDAAGWIDPWAQRDNWRSHGPSVRSFAMEFQGQPQTVQLTAVHDGNVLLQVAGALQCTLFELLGDVTTANPEWLLIRELLENANEATLRRAALLSLLRASWAAASRSALATACSLTRAAFFVSAGGGSDCRGAAEPPAHQRPMNSPISSDN